MSPTPAIFGLAALALASSISAARLRPFPDSTPTADSRAVQPLESVGEISLPAIDRELIAIEDAARRVSGLPYRLAGQTPDTSYIPARRASFPRSSVLQLIKATLIGPTTVSWIFSQSRCSQISMYKRKT